MSTINVIFIGSDNLLEVSRLKNELTGTDLNSAAVTVTLVDAAGAQVAGDTWPKTMAYAPDSDGLYRCTLPYTLTLTPSARYTAQITANAGNGLRAYWELECVARARS